MLPWAGCAVLAADGDELRRIRGRADSAADVLLVDMPEAAQLTRVCDEYPAVVAAAPSEGLDCSALAIVGPRNRVDRLVGRLPLLP